MSADPFHPPESSDSQNVAQLARQARQLLGLLRGLLFVVFVGVPVLASVRGDAPFASILLQALLAWSFAAPLRRQSRALDQIEGGAWEGLWDLAVGHLRLVRWLAMFVGLFWLALLGTP
ncbi:MAG: hypothetical protein AAF602_01070 [Myxococcota bacterium]